MKNYRSKNISSEFTVLLYRPDGTSEEVPVTFTRSRRKTVSVSVSEDGSIRLRAPFFVPERECLDFLRKSQDWILKNLDKRRAFEEAHPKADLTPVQIEVMEKIYRDAAYRYLPERAAYYAPIIGVTYNRIFIRSQKTRWGSCSADGNLNFNWRLMMAPPRIQDYVVVHELCHRLHMNHSPAFWACVERVLPDYRERRRWLKENESLLTVSALDFHT